MTSLPGGPPLLTDCDVDALAWQFLHSPYADDTYADWPLDRRLDGFLRRQGLARLVEHGDAYDIILDRVMAYIAARGRSSPTFRLAEPTNGPHIDQTRALEPLEVTSLWIAGETPETYPTGL